MRFLAPALIFLCLSAGTLIQAQSPGMLYHQNIRRANACLKSKSCPLDSVLFYYEKARAGNVFYFHDQANILGGVVRQKDTLKAKQSLLEGANEGVQWKDYRSYFGLRKRTEKRYFSDREPVWQSVRLKDWVTKSEFSKAYTKKNTQAPAWVKRTIRKAGRLDQKGGREWDTKEGYDQRVVWDNQMFHLLKSIVDSLGRIPSYQELGENLSFTFTTCLLHLDAEQLHYLFPYFTKAIHEGDFFEIGDLVYTIERVAQLYGMYLVLENDSLVIKDLTSSFLPDWGNPYGYLGDIEIRNVLDTSRNRTPFIIPPRHPAISMEAVNQLRDSLCAETFEEYLQRVGVKVVSVEEFQKAQAIYYGE